MPSHTKELMVTELRNTVEANTYIFFAAFQNLSVSDMSELRRKLEKSYVDRAIVSKNSMTRRVLKDLGMNGDEFVKGTVLMALGSKEPQVISKALVDFSKDRENFKVVGAFLERKKVIASEVKSIAGLPTRQVLLGQVVCGINAPVQGFVTVLNQLVQGLVVALGQIQTKKAAQAAS